MLKNFFRNKIVYLGILTLFFSLFLINTPDLFLADDISTYSDRTQGFDGASTVKLQYLSYGVWKDAPTGAVAATDWSIDIIHSDDIDQVYNADECNLRYVFTFDSSVVMDGDDDVSLTWLFIAKTLAPQGVIEGDTSVDINPYEIVRVSVSAINENGNLQRIPSSYSVYQYPSLTSRIQVDLYTDFDFKYFEVSVYFRFPECYGISGWPSGYYQFGTYLGNNSFWNITDGYSLPDILDNEVGELPDIDQYVPDTTNPLIYYMRVLTDIPIVKSSLLVVGVLGVTAFVFFGKR